MDCTIQLLSGTESSVRCPTVPRNVRQACARLHARLQSAAQRRRTRLALEEQEHLLAQLRLLRAQLRFVRAQLRLVRAQRSHLGLVVRRARCFDFRLQRLQLLVYGLDLRIHLVDRRLVGHNGRGVACVEKRRRARAQARVRRSGRTLSTGRQVAPHGTSAPHTPHATGVWPALSRSRGIRSARRLARRGGEGLKQRLPRALRPRRAPPAVRTRSPRVADRSPPARGREDERKCKTRPLPKLPSAPARVPRTPPRRVPRATYHVNGGDHGATRTDAAACDSPTSSAARRAARQAAKRSQPLQQQLAGAGATGVHARRADDSGSWRWQTV